MMLALLVVTLLGVAAVDLSETGVKQPISTPEVVVQLKYDGGELDRIYLTQFRKDQRSAVVVARTNVCADLCHSGLGGESCGSTCGELMPVGLKLALQSGNTSSEQYGEPRVGVCPVLCDNHLGEPLCSCSDTTRRLTNWTMVCQAFCLDDNYTLSGCPTCEESAVQAPQIHSVTTLNVGLDTNEGWQAWCNVQCRQGMGGAACNCDRTPF